ncbi:hypothetical protein [Micromonospora coxensis]|uniref:Uncharacterized protein n=1 Tax=Micromonospora coxensis TaxID=356852 RepID=A0A1C5JNH2_9ACTN|nr:hypothetical protein [Micromonospora coxensis]SCG72120.1 hypothetical protein GA0070614_4944 [Micromonospora coxensis]
MRARRNQEFDPARRSFRVSWLPEGLIDRTWSGGRDAHSLVAVAPPRRSPGPVRGTAVGEPMVGRPVVTVRLGTGAEEVSIRWRARRPARVHGLPAVLRSSADGRHSALCWEHVPGVGVRVMATGLPAADVALLRVAEGLVWTDEPVRVPLRPVPPPLDAPLHRTLIERRDGRWHRVLFSHRVPGSALPYEDLTVGVVRDDGPPGADTTTVAGRVARAASGLGAFRVGGAGWGVAAEVVAVTFRGLAALGGPDGALALAAAVRLVDDHEDESGWSSVRGVQPFPPRTHP